MRRTDPSALAWLVGNELRQARERLGETQASAAAVIGCSTSRMNYLESGRTVQLPHDVRTLMHFYGADTDGERLAELVRSPGRRAWWTPWKPVIPEQARLFIGLEGLASTAFGYQPLVVPELLQVRGYAAALVGPSAGSPVVRDRVVELRQARQQRLFDDERPLHGTAVIDEEALDRQVGGPSVLREQLDHLLALGERCTVQVIPRSVAVHDGLDGGFTVLDFEAARPVTYLSGPEHGVYLSEPHAVAGYLYRRERLRSAALTPAESRTLIAARRAAH